MALDFRVRVFQTQEIKNLSKRLHLNILKIGVRRFMFIHPANQADGDCVFIVACRVSKGCALRPSPL